MMTPERWARIDDVFHQVVDLAAPERERHLASAFSDDESLRDELRQLLAAHDASGPLERTAEDNGRLPALEWVGPYRLIRKLGEGGMGVVHLAERSGDGFTQVVALKLIRAGFATKGLEARLAEERRILARLDHPGIARFIDGGTTPSGQPYVAIEYIQGADLLQFCTSRNLSLRQRLALFAEVCDAVHYAHQQLVVHRDLKPGNILVTNDGRPKLLDFGLAKVLEDDGSHDATQTAPWVTPAYASPEQMCRSRISTLTDVYALGVVLYELLTGCRPHDLAGLPPAEMVRLVCNATPRLPSAMLSEHAGAAEPRRRQLQGDLDVIALKALAKEPERRYGSAAELADDIRRHIDGRPVLARRDSVWYRTGKFAARHRTGVSVATVILLLLTAGLGVSLWQAREARAARDRAEMAMRQSDDVTSFLLGLLQASDPMTALGDTLAAREILRRGAAEAERLTGQPALQARLFDALGQIYDVLGRYSEALNLLQRAFTLRRATFGPAHNDVAMSLEHLGTHYRRIDAHARAESLYRSALEMRERLEGPESPAIAETLALLGFLMPYLGKAAESEDFYRRSVAMKRRVLPPNDDGLSATLLQLASAATRVGKFDEAESIVREAVAMRTEAHGARDARVAEAETYLADLLANYRAQYAEAERLYREALEIERAAFGPRHLQLVHGLDGLGDVLERQGKTIEAEKVLRESMQFRREAFGPRHVLVGESMASLAGFLQRQKRYTEAEALLRETLAIFSETLGPQNGSVASTKAGIANLLVDMGRYREADRLYLEAIAIREKVSGPTHGHIAIWLTYRAHMLTLTGRFAEAEADLKRALNITEPQNTAAHPITQDVLRKFVELYRAWGRPDDAAKFAERLSLAEKMAR
jgi:serine/threonine-protein kinase